jgi:peptide/nickel transport system permease protein
MSAIANGPVGTTAPPGTVAEPVVSGGAGPHRRTRPGAGVLRAIRGNAKAMTGAALLLVFTVVAIAPQLLTSVKDPNKREFDISLLPSAQHLLGTTSFGQDIWAQLVWGTRQSLLVAVAAGAGATVLSVLIGVTAAYVGGVTDGVLSLLTDVFLVLPTLPLIIVLTSYVGTAGILVVITVLIVTGWSYGARQLRAQALSLRNRDFLVAARVRGERASYIVVFEVLPTMVSLITANFLGAALYAVLTAAGLQYIGLGDPSASSWGTMLHWGQSAEALQTGQQWWVIAPGLCIALLGAAFALLNYAFDEVSNPALRPVRRVRARR